MAFGTFNLVVDWSVIDGSARDCVVDITPNPFPLLDTGGHVVFDKVTAARVRTTRTFTLYTDVTTGTSTAIQYHVTVRSRSQRTPLLDKIFYAPAAGQTLYIDTITTVPFVAIPSAIAFPSGGSDGQALVKSGAAVVWGTVSGGGGGGSSYDGGTVA